MPGGLLQLNAYGSQNQYLNGNPQMTFFKVVYRRYTNFSNEYIRQEVKGPNELSNNTPIQLNCKINRHGDLIQQIYFAFNIPNIYSSYDKETSDILLENFKNPTVSLYKFQWIKNLGSTIINWVSISIAGQEIDKQYGEWIQVWNELNLSNEELTAYNKMIGNIPELFSPEYSIGQSNIYPLSSLNPKENVDFQIPNIDSIANIYNPYYKSFSIKGRKIYVPLNFWFCKNPGLSLPLIALQYHDIYLRIELRPLIDLYTLIETNINNNKLGQRVKPNPLRQTQSINNFITSRTNWTIEELVETQISSNMDDSNDNTEITPFQGWGLDPHFLINYYFLDKEERKRFAKTTHEYLITQVYTSSFFGIVGTKTLDLKIQHPVKQLIWTTRRSDMNSINNWNNLTNWLLDNVNPNSFVYYDYLVNNNFIPPDNNINNLDIIIPNKSNSQYFEEHILKKARLLFNGEERFAANDFSFFNLLQPFEYCIRSPRPGIYVYSFSIDKNNFQPSGSCNMSRIQNIELEVECVETPKRISLNQNLQYLYGFDINVYSVNYNVLRIMGGMGSIVFSN